MVNGSVCSGTPLCFNQETTKFFFFEGGGGAGGSPEEDKEDTPVCFTFCGQQVYSFYSTIVLGATLNWCGNLSHAEAESAPSPLETQALTKPPRNQSGD